MVEDKKTLAALLRQAVARSIPEDEFWVRFNALSGCLQEDMTAIILETATHYWGNFHSRSIVFGLPLAADKEQVRQGENELSLIADGLESGLKVEEIEKRLKEI